MHDRIREHTRESINKRIDRQTLGAVADSIGSTDEISIRLRELDREWHVDRALMLNFAVLGGLSGGMAMRNLARRGRIGGWGLFFWVQVGFLAYHAVRGWCPPLPVFRRLGFRSANEIGAEREVLHEALKHAST
ncbi:MAG: hypothetical protein F9K40_12320 [Kofleriaceae bacterium]|nr:MAG: hypothetical protein F9K40_12320 [Kofleriaceae bacterium]MBZ0235986.1 hypothetical protein [Kofleriaceae bacterium]